MLFERFGRPIAWCAALSVTIWSGCLPEPSSRQGSGQDQAETAATDFAQAAGPYLNLDPSVTYVGIDACLQCHRGQVGTYTEAQMGRSFKPATRTASAANWNNTPSIYDPTVDFYYHPFAVGDSLYILEYRLSGADTVFKRIEKIDYIVGSGQHTNSHMMDVNGYLYQIPITWYVQEGRWDLPPGFAGGHNWRFERAIEVECMTCHNGMPDYVAGSDNRYRKLPHGIDCERCHGPGSLHVAEKQAGRIVDTNREIDRTIVNPAKLPLDLQFDVCQRCHLQGVAVPQEGLSFTDFRPGMRLGDVIDTYFPRYTDSLSHFIMASHPDRLRMSKCRVPSPNRPGQTEPLPCVTCHNPHVPVEAVSRDVYNQACIDCHGGSQAAREEWCPEDLSARMARGDDCSGCHMPFVGSIDIPHVKITDHNIRIPDRSDVSPDSNTSKGDDESGSQDHRFIRLASLTEHQPTDKDLGEGYLAYFEQFNNVPRFLDSAAVYLARAREHNSDQSMARALIRLWYLEKKYDQVAAFVERVPLPDDLHAWTYYRIGEAYSGLGRHADARDYYQKAVDRGPDHLWFRTKLASSFVALQQPDRAIEILDRVIEDNPKFQQAYNNRGYAYVLLGDFDQAESDFKTVLALDPDAKQALANLASLYFNTGDPERARPLVEHLLQLEPENASYQAFLEAIDGGS